MVNIADESEIKKRNEQLKNKKNIESDELKMLLQDKKFRNFVWRLLVKTKMFESIWRQSAEIHYLSGQQDLGHFLWAEIEAASSELVFQMMRENKENKEEKKNA